MHRLRCDVVAAALMAGLIGAVAGCAAPQAVPDTPEPVPAPTSAAAPASSAPPIRLSGPVEDVLVSIARATQTTNDELATCDATGTFEQCSDIIRIHRIRMESVNAAINASRDKDALLSLGERADKIDSIADTVIQLCARESSADAYSTCSVFLSLLRTENALLVSQIRSLTD